MKEIKYLSHIPRNAVLLFFFYAALKIADNHTILSEHFLQAIVAITLVYAPVYFINDYYDRNEDKKHGKHNLYLAIKNSRIFWFLAGVLFISGTLLSLSISQSTMFPIILLYIFNSLYTIPPFRFRNRPLFRETNLLVIYIFKSILILQYLQYPFNKLSLILLVFLSFTSAYSLTIYKRHLVRSKLAEYIFGTIFYAFLIAVLLTYPRLTALLLPMAPLSLYLAITNKNKQVYLGLYELVYFVWGVCVFVIMG